MNKISKLIILACACQSLQAGEVFWANGVDQSSGWSVYLQYPNQCWGAVAGNTLGWWQANLQASLNLKEGAPQGNKEITDWFYEKYPHIQGGLQPYRGMIYYLQDFSPGFKLYEDNNNPTYLERTYGPTKISGAPFWTERYDSAANGIVKSLVDNFKTGKVVAALTDDTHTVVLWGIEVDADGRIKKGYVSDSVVDKNGDLTLREVVGNYVPDYKTGEMNFRFLYSYYVSKTNTYITDAYEIYSITYLSIDEARNNGTYVDTSNRQDCLLSVLPGDEWACAIQTNNPQEGGSENTGGSSGSESAGSGQSPDNGATNNPSSGGSSQTPPSGGSSSGSSSGGESLENNQGGGSSGINPGNNPQQGGSGNAGSSGGGNTGSQTPPSSDVANHETTQAVQEAASKHSELSIAVEEIGNVTFYRIQKNGKDIALYNPHFSKPLITNKGLVDYDIQTHADGGIEITKTINQAAVQEANDVSALNMDINYVDINNLNKRMGELRGIDANAGAWARILGGKGSSSGFENTFTHIQAGFDKQSEIAGGGKFLAASP